MMTYAHKTHDEIYYEVISHIVRSTDCTRYLELGIQLGINMDYVKRYCPYCVGVDIIDIRTSKDYLFHQMTTDDFFAMNNEMFDIIFIDADHSFESVKKDFANSLKILNEFGIIFLHDTDPIDESYTAPYLCGDSYKIIDWIRINYPELDIITLPIGAPGLTIVNRKNEKRILK